MRPTNTKVSSDKLKFFFTERPTLSPTGTRPGRPGTDVTVADPTAVWVAALVTELALVLSQPGQAAARRDRAGPAGCADERVACLAGVGEPGDVGVECR